MYVEPIEEAAKNTLQDILKGKVSVESTVYSDPWKSDRGLKDTFNVHETIDHGAKQYVQDKATINGIEGFWAFAEEHLRRHHGISAGNFEYYLKEKELRWNKRDLKQDDFVKLLVHILAHKVGS